MSTKFFVAKEEFRMPRSAWAESTGLPESAPAEELVEAFLDRELRPSFEDEELSKLFWKPNPTLAQEEQLSKELQANASTMFVETQVFEDEDKIIGTYFISLGIEEAEEPAPAPVVVPENKPNSWPLALTTGLALGFISTSFIKQTPLKWLVGLSVGVASTIGMGKLLTRRTKESLL